MIDAILYVINMLFLSWFFPESYHWVVFSEGLRIAFFVVFSRVFSTVFSEGLRIAFFVVFSSFQYGFFSWDLRIV